MSVFKPIPNQAQTFNSTYKITGDVSGWDRVTIQVIAPFSGSILVYGSLDSGASQQVTQGNAELAINFMPIQATNLATGSASGTISAAGEYVVDVRTQFLRLQGVPATAGTNVYRLLQLNQKLG